MEVLLAVLQLLIVLLGVLKAYFELRGSGKEDDHPDARDDGASDGVPSPLPFLCARKPVCGPSRQRGVSPSLVPYSLALQFPNG